MYDLTKFYICGKICLRKIVIIFTVRKELIMLNIKYNGSKAKAVFNGINLTFGNTGLVFICGKKESSAKTLVKYLAGVEYVEGLEITVDDFVLNHPALVDDYRLYNIGLVFANTQYIENETVFANVLSSPNNILSKYSNYKSYLTSLQQPLICLLHLLHQFFI